MATKKLYIAIAEKVRNTDLPEDQKFELAHALGEAFKADNQRFDVVRFVDACMGR